MNLLTLGIIFVCLIVVSIVSFLLMVKTDSDNQRKWYFIALVLSGVFAIAFLGAISNNLIQLL